jgi:hypothetical protein
VFSEALSKLKELGEFPVEFRHLFLLVLLIMATPNLLELIKSQIHRPEISNSEESSYGIQKIITKVRDELYETSLETANKYPDDLFVLKSMELDLSFVVKTSKSAKQGAEIELITVGSESQVSQEKVQRIKLVMGAKEATLHRAKPTDKPVNWEDGVETMGALPPVQHPGGKKPVKFDH